MKIKGFTLIEVMTALSVFAVIMTISMGSILGVFDANRKSESLKTIMDNLNFAMESMAREIRFGKNYHCGNSGNLTDPLDCASPNNFISFLSADGRQITYTNSFTPTRLQKSLDTITYNDVTAPEVTITDLRFIVVGSRNDDSLQPRVFILIKGYAGTKLNSRSSFTIQTMVTQRARDI